MRSPEGRPAKEQKESFGKSPGAFHCIIHDGRLQVLTVRKLQEGRDGLAWFSLWHVPVRWQVKMAGCCASNLKRVLDCDISMNPAAGPMPQCHYQKDQHRVPTIAIPLVQDGTRGSFRAGVTASAGPSSGNPRESGTGGRTGTEELVGLFNGQWPAADPKAEEARPRHLTAAAVLVRAGPHNEAC